MSCSPAVRPERWVVSVGNSQQWSTALPTAEERRRQAFRGPLVEARFSPEPLRLRVQEAPEPCDVLAEAAVDEVRAVRAPRGPGPLDRAGDERVGRSPRVAEDEFARPYQQLPRKAVKPRVRCDAGLDLPIGQKIVFGDPAAHPRLRNAVLEAEMLAAPIVEFRAAILTQHMGSSFRRARRRSLARLSARAVSSAAMTRSTSTSRPGPPTTQFAGCPSANGSVGSPRYADRATARDGTPRPRSRPAHLSAARGSQRASPGRGGSTRH